MLAFILVIFASCGNHNQSAEVQSTLPTDTTIQTDTVVQVVDLTDTSKVNRYLMEHEFVVMQGYGASQVMFQMIFKTEGNFKWFHDINNITTPTLGKWESDPLVLSYKGVPSVTIYVSNFYNPRGEMVGVFYLRNDGTIIEEKFQTIYKPL